MRAQQAGVSVAAGGGRQAKDSARRVLFLLMPWAHAHNGGLGVATLKSILNRDGIEVDCRYPNITFASQIGVDLYRFIGATGGSRYRGEIFFTPYYFDLPVAGFVDETLEPYYRQAIELFQEVLGGELRQDSGARFINLCRRVCVHDVPAFLERTMASIDWDAYDIVGFSLMFHQTLASLCVAKRVKQAFPDKIIVFGGPSCAGDMGREMMRAFPCVDVVASGEADEIITALVRTIRSGGSLAAVPGIMFRKDREVICTTPAPPVMALDALPIPDYDDYMRAIRQAPEVSPRLFFETSRGCWWGQKHLCSFCGLNAEGLGYRKKSPERAIEEILGIARRYGVNDLQAADNIIDMSYFKSVLPAIARYNDANPTQERLSIAYETKSNLKREQLELMKRAGVDDIQPGIESLSDHVLTLMDKGATGIQQVQCIKWSTELNIKTTYGVLYNNPGEAIEDYEEMLALIDFLRHLAPPSYVTPVILDRFSPYFRNPSKYGIRNIRPQDGDARSFPDPAIALEKLAYHFDYDHDQHADLRLQAVVDQCVARLRRWRDEYAPDLLVYEEREGNIYVLDRRDAKPALSRLRGIQAKIFSYFDAAHGFGATTNPWPEIPVSVVRNFLGTLIERKWMYRDKRERYITLAVRRSFLETIVWKEPVMGQTNSMEAEGKREKGVEILPP